MHYEVLGQKQYALRLARGEKLMEGLATFCQREQIDGAFFTGIGAVDHAELAHYNVETQKYSTKQFDQALEVTHLTGTISRYEGEIIIHAHGTFSDTNMHCLGGHVVDMQISGTLELWLVKTAALSKLVDSETGLKLLNLPFKL
jgi:predicted DNA-binding protein with PD1-like motif